MNTLYKFACNAKNALQCTFTNTLVINKHGVKYYYYGDIIDKQPNGMGKLYKDDKSTLVYHGEWKDGKPDGQGILYREDDKTIVYDGQWKDGLYHGQGKLYREDGKTIKYDGQWKDGLYHGQGKLYREDGKTIKYDGQWKDDKYHGQGKLYREDGKTIKYDGQWKDDKYHGQGKLYREDGKTIVYDGQWKDGLYHGQGILYDLYGSIYYQGTFNNNKVLDKIFYDNGNLKYEGFIENGKPNGQAIYYQTDGITKIYDGQLKDGRYHGFGILYHQNGETIKYIGFFKNNKFHGKGKLDKDGTELYSEFQNGNPIPSKLGLPTELSSMSPLQISKEIIKDINRFEGPIYTALLIPKSILNDELGRNPPVILLLGDYHYGTNRCNSCTIDSKCYSLYKENLSFLHYLNSKSKQLNWSIDLFLEGWIGKNDRTKNTSESYYPDNQNSALIQLIDITETCVGQRKDKLRLSCMFDNFRIHNTDLRKLTGRTHDKYTADSIVNRLRFFNENRFTLTNISEFKKLLEFEFTGYKADDIILQIKKIVTPYTPIDFFLDEPFFQKYSRMYHEFMQLPESIRENLRININSLYKYTINVNEFMQYFSEKDIDFDLLFDTLLISGTNEISSKIDDRLRKFCKHLNNIYGLLNFSILSVDLYTISRSLKLFDKSTDKGLPSQLSVVYQGATHIKNDIKLLKDYYDIVMEFGSDIYSGPNIKKCIYEKELSKTPAKSIAKINKLESKFKKMLQEEDLSEKNSKKIVDSPQIQTYIQLREALLEEEISNLEKDMTTIYTELDTIMTKQNGNVDKIKTLFLNHDLQKYLNKNNSEILKILDIFGYKKELALDLESKIKYKILCYIILSIVLMTPEDFAKHILNVLKMSPKNFSNSLN